MSEQQETGAGEEEQPRSMEMPRPRAVGSPLAMGSGSRAAIPSPRLQAPPEETAIREPKFSPPVLVRPRPDQTPLSETRLEPSRLDPTRLDPTRLDPTRLDPARPDPARLAPAGTEQTEDSPATPPASAPREIAGSRPAPSQSAPAQRTPGNSASSHSASQSASGDPAPALAPELPSSLQRAVNGVRAAWPFVQKILPLLDGQVVSVVSNLLTPHHPSAAQVNLEPIESSLALIRSRDGELSDQLTQQNSSLKRVEDRLEMVREATDRNTLEQQELMADLKAVGRKVNVIAVIALLLLAGSIAVNVLLFLHLRRVLP